MAFLKSIDGSVLALPNLWQTWIWNKPACCAGCSLSTEVLVHRNHQIGLFFVHGFFWKRSHFFGYSYSENKIWSEKSMARSFNGRTYKFKRVQRKKSFFTHDLKTWVFHHDPMTFSYSNIVSAESSVMLFSERIFLPDIIPLYWYDFIPMVGFKRVHQN